MRGLPSTERRRLKKRAQPRPLPLRAATINIGTLTGRTRELADILRRRRVDVACIQETKWKGSKAREIGDGYKLLYHGTRNGRNGIAVVIAEHLRDKITLVERLSDRLLAIKIDTGKKILRVVSAYAPQVGCSDEEKNEFWTALDEIMASIPDDETLLLGGDLNGHVGQNKGGAGKCHGGRGYGTRNDEGERILEFAEAHDLVLANTYFVKPENHLVTYASGDHKTQIDYWAVRSSELKNIKDCKVIPGESCLPQHRVLILDFWTPVNRRRRPMETKERIKWWKLKDTPTMKEEFIRTLPEQRGTPDEVWQHLEGRVHKAATRLIGKTKPGRRRIEKETWWWREEIQEVIRAKKQAYKNWQKTRLAEDRASYKEKKRAAKAAVREAKREDVAELYQSLDTPEGGRQLIYRIARARAAASKDMTHFAQMKDPQGRTLRRPEEIQERWRAHFEGISTKEFDHPPIPEDQPREGPVPPITRLEVTRALSKMKRGKATGPDDISSEFWKTCGPAGTDWLTRLLNQVILQGQMPKSWSTSTTVPIWKGKGDIADCSTYRPIRLMSHTLKILERIIDQRLREIVDISENQCGFVKGLSTTDAIHSARLLLEKHREKNKTVHAAFLDLEKAFDRVPHEVIWWALRKHQVPEEYINWIKMIYRNATSSVRSSVGTTREFPITVGVHQGSALSPLLFVTVMDAVTRDLQKPAPWTLLYADDVALFAETRKDLEEDVIRWKTRLAEFGMKLNIKKTEYMESGEQTPGTINVGEPLEKTTCFRYLGSRFSSEGSVQADAVARTNAAWMKWREFTGVFCDRRMPRHLKSKLYRTVVRPTALYGSECWPATKKDESRLAVMETRMLRWTQGVTMMDRIPNDIIRTNMGVAPIVEKMREKRLGWYGHVQRRPEDHLVRKALEMEVPGRRPRGRPKLRWLDKISADLTSLGLSREDTLDRQTWKSKIRSADPAVVG